MSKTTPIKEKYFVIEYAKDAEQTDWLEWSEKKYLSISQAQETAKQYAHSHLLNEEKLIHGFRVVEIKIETTVEIVTEFLI
jgi:hypothetical protein